MNQKERMAPVSGDLRTRPRLYRIVAIAFLLLVSAGIAGAIFYHRSGSGKIVHPITVESISQDFAPGMQADAVETVMSRKYNATIVRDISTGSRREILFNITEPADNRGVSRMMLVTVNFEDQKISSVESELGGLGP